jgi:hypothetical protein
MAANQSTIREPIRIYPCRVWATPEVCVPLGHVASISQAQPGLSFETGDHSVFGFFRMVSLFL